MGPCRRIRCLRYPQFSIAVDRLYLWLAVKGTRDIVSGLFVFLLMANGSPRLLGEFMLVASLIAFGDVAIVLRSGGSRTAAFGIHGVTALVIIAVGAILIGGAK